MTIQFELGSGGRKPLVTAVGEILGLKPKYMGAPGFCYAVGDYIIDSNGTLTVSDNAHALIAELELRGFTRIYEPTRTVLTVSAEDFGEQAQDNLKKLIAAKAPLIQKALTADSLDFHLRDGFICFEWFEKSPAAEELASYTQFLSALCKTAKEQQRVTAKWEPVENEKYAFRCSLLKLGFIGKEYAETRRILLSRLSGNASFRNG